MPPDPVHAPERIKAAPCPPHIACLKAGLDGNGEGEFLAGSQQFEPGRFGVGRFEGGGAVGDRLETETGCVRGRIDHAIVCPPRISI